MNNFIYQTIILLEDMGMSAHYPSISYLINEKDGLTRAELPFSLMMGRRVSIDENKKIKFLILFTMLDYYIDCNNPELEGASYAKKYKNLPNNDDNTLILKELFRIAKLLRNGLVHSPSCFDINSNKLIVSYQFKGTAFKIDILITSLEYLFAAILMFAKGRHDSSKYFTGVIKLIFEKITNGISEFSDEFGSSLSKPSNGNWMKTYNRIIAMNSNYKIHDDIMALEDTNTNPQEGIGVDFHIIHNEDDFLVPIEVLEPGLKIDLGRLEEWKYRWTFPPLYKGAKKA